MALQKDLIRKTEEFLRRKYDEGEYLNRNPSQKAYRLEHSFRVANICKSVARQEGMDETALAIAGLLHDVSYCTEFIGEDGWLNHGRSSARIARPFLESLGLPGELIEEICYGIAIHVDNKADFEGRRTPFALTVGDADNIDRFDAYRIYEGLQYNKFSEMSLDEKKVKVNSVLSQLHNLRDMEMGTAAAKAIWQERIDFNTTFYKKLECQLANSAQIF